MKVIIDDIPYILAPEVPNDKSVLAALETRFDSDAGDNITVRDYFRVLLETLWDEGEGFSGKRPFGNSGWEYELYKPLIKHGFVSGTLDECEDISTFNKEECDAYVFKLISVAFNGANEGL